MVDVKMIIAHAFAYSLNIVALVFLDVAFLTVEPEGAVIAYQVIFIFTSTAT